MATYLNEIGSRFLESNIDMEHKPGIMNTASGKSNGHHVSRTLWIFYCVGSVVMVSVMFGHLYVDTMNKPVDMPQRFKVTMIDNMCLMVLQTAEMFESFGLAHQLNITRGFFERATELLCMLENSVITHSIKYIIGSGVTVVGNVCDGLNLDFCRPKPVDDADLLLGDDVITVDDVFDGVPVRLFRPNSVSDITPQPAIIYVHGAVVMGTIDVWDGLLRMYAASTKATIIYIEYRWPPEHIFPASLNDCLRVTRWVLRNAERYQIDPKSIALQGDSAGGVIASVIAQTIATEHERDPDNNPELKMLILLMPLLQGLDLNLPSHNTNGPIFPGVLSRLLIAKFWVWYMGMDSEDLVMAILEGKHLSADFRKSERFQKLMGHDLLPKSFRIDDTLHNNLNISDSEDSTIVDKLSPFFLNATFSPLMAEHISGHHPHTLIVTSGFDILRDDGVIYAHRLRRAGVKVWWRHFENGFHSCNAYWQGVLRTDIGHQVLKETVELVEAYLHEPADKFYS